MPDSQPPASTGLPMTSRWDPAQLKRDTETLLALEQQPLATRLRGYFKLTGPAWMQSAMTLGAGSAAASVVARARFTATNCSGSSRSRCCWAFS